MTTGYSACEADSVSLSYTTCYVRMARNSHEASYVIADPFTNMFVFFMSDAMKAVNPFLGRMPRELHEQYMTDFLTEIVETAAVETKKNTDDCVFFFKYKLIVAFARKT